MHADRQPGIIAKIDLIGGVRSEIDHCGNRAGQLICIGIISCDQSKAFWTDRYRHRPFALIRDILRKCDDAAAGKLDGTFACPAIDKFTDQKVTVADKVRNKAMGRCFVNLARRADLKNFTRFHNGNPVRHRQGFFLIVGDEYEGNPGFRLQAFEFDLHFLAQFQIKRGQRLIKQQNLWRRCKSTRQCDTLLLTTGKLAWDTVTIFFQPDQFEHLFCPAIGLLAACALHFQTKGDVLFDRQMREQGIGLEHRIDWALEWRQIIQCLAFKQDLAGGRLLKPANKAQQSRFTAARRAQHGEKLVLKNIHRH